MAKSQNLLLLYDYLYNATSRLVHFSPGTLLRMAWFDPKDGIKRCNPNAFDRYYSEFARFYSTHLLAAFVTRFKIKLRLSAELVSAIDEKLKIVNTLVRWPELITFEELNVDNNPWADKSIIRKQSFWNILIKDPGVIFVPK